MVAFLSDRQIQWLRLRSQQLEQPGSGDAVSVLADLCGAQAQDSSAGTLSAGLRGSRFTVADIDHARASARSLVRVWSLRGTIHFHPTQDIDWLLPLLRPYAIERGRSVRTRLGLDQAACDSYLDELRAVMSGQGLLSGQDISRLLAGRGIHLPADARLLLMNYASWKGLICMGPERSARPTYVLLDEWITPGTPLERSEALQRLVLRYLTAFAPATPEDCACWSGLPLTEIRATWQALAGQLLAVEHRSKILWLRKDRSAWLDEPLPAQPTVQLVPAFDTYLLGYKNRELLISPRDVPRIYAGSMIYPSLLIDGRVQGMWSLKKHRQQQHVTIQPFVELSQPVLEGLAQARTNLERFLAAPITWQVQAV
jgi:hypothetical protein